jgi:hypothetical protein
MATKHWISEFFQKSQKAAKIFSIALQKNTPNCVYSITRRNFFVLANE